MRVVDAVSVCVPLSYGDAETLAETLGDAENDGELDSVFEACAVPLKEPEPVALGESDADSVPLYVVVCVSESVTE